MGADNGDHSNVAGKVVGRRAGEDRRTHRRQRYKGLEKRRSDERRTSRDKRKYRRFRVKDLTFVKLWSEADEDIGQLLDISEGGLSLRYFVNVEKSGDYSELGIFLSGDDFTIDRIPFKTVSNTMLVNKSPFSPIILRRYGIKFEELTPEQVHKLDLFLDKYTLGEA